jgi:outer membrane protein OmpA-like peptidoglycan-associated protein
MAICALLAAAPAAAGDEARLGFSLQAIVSGDDHPAIVLEPGEPVKNVTIKLERQDGAKSTLSSGAIAAGGKKVVPVKQPVGELSYKAHFDASYASGDSASFDMQFTLTRVEKLKLELAPADVNLDARTMTFKINNRAKSATLELYGKDGAKVKTVTRDLQAAAGSTPLTISWDDPGQELLYLDLKVTDIAGFWKGVRLTPFSVSIPHEEVEFETGRWDIRPSEEPKLNKTLGLIKDALDKHGKLIELRLYVAGYTDTVGSKESNRTLSNHRARAIAGWFAKNGLKVPIYFQGFGEDALAKPTPDETPEQANRRALYVLSSQTPAVSTSLPRPNWTRL